MNRSTAGPVLYEILFDRRVLRGDMMGRQCMYSQLYQRIQDRSARIAVIGLGYIGLPLAVEKAKAGFTVVGLDRSAQRVAMVNRGENYISDILGQELALVVEQGKLSATGDFSVVAHVDVISICVPTPLDKNKQPDTSYIEGVLEQSLPYLSAGQLVVLESTTYPGTTEEVILPRLEAHGLKVGTDIFLAFSPERVDPGNKDYKTKNTAKVVGGVTPACTDIATILYQQVLDGKVFSVSSPRVAEMAKLLENIFRIVNITLVNELALLCEKMGIDIWEVIEAAKTKPFGFMPFYPGPGLGGHCIPFDPFYLSWKAREYDFSTRFIELAGQINDAMPQHVVERAMEILNDTGKPIRGTNIMLLGMAYKRDIGDLRESPALKVARLLADRGAVLTYHDPYIPKVDEKGLTLCSIDLNPQNLAIQDLVIITTDHSNLDYRMVVEHASSIFDTRNATKGLESLKIIRLGAGSNV
ncbi:MAG TPA: nucleotide sugar dehydrogenase [Candidatus Limnocylindrales bacterium]|nr:nucleotide sugar dehydrogenase [Candidatus Limnocylindrales bacterium]